MENLSGLVCSGYWGVVSENDLPYLIHAYQYA